MWPKTLMDSPANPSPRLKRRSTLSTSGWHGGDGLWSNTSNETPKRYTIPAGWDARDFNAASIRRLARKCLLPSAIQYDIAPADLRRLMLALWIRYAEIKQKTEILRPEGLMYVLMRRAAQKIPELRTQERAPGWEEKWRRGNDLSVMSPHS
jgi:hypothetical protein